MKIGIFISTLNFGGAEKQAIVDATLLAEDHQIVFIVFQAGPLVAQLPESAELVLLTKTNYFATARRLVRVVKDKHIDIVHAHLFAPMVISSIATLIGGAPVIWNFHAHAYEDAKRVRFAQGLVSKLPGVKKLLFPANELKAYYRKEQFSFPAWKELVFFNSGQFWGKQQYQEQGSKEVIIGFVGRIIPLKRVLLLVELAKELKNEGLYNFRISIVGDGRSLDEVKDQAREKDVLDVVDFHGFQSNTHYYYQQFSIFALPSEEEVLSLSLIDAQLTGLPCVAFDVGGNADIVEHGRSGFIVRDKRAFFDHIRELVCDSKLRRQMGIRAIEQSTVKFSQQSRVTNLEALYQHVLS